jgi:hypothetical protein
VLGLTCSSAPLRSLSELSTNSPEGVYDTLCCCVDGLYTTGPGVFLSRVGKRCLTALLAMLLVPECETSGPSLAGRKTMMPGNRWLKTSVEPYYCASSRTCSASKLRNVMFERLFKCWSPMRLVLHHKQLRLSVF